MTSILTTAATLFYPPSQPQDDVTMESHSNQYPLLNISTASESLNNTSDYDYNRTTTTAVKYTRPPRNADDLLLIYFGPVIFILGLCGNAMTILVMCRKRLRGTTTSIYMPAMAIADMVALTSGIIPEWMDRVGFPLFANLHAITCRLEKLTFYSSSDTAIWIIVLFTFDRFVAVCFPFQKSIVCVPRRSKIASVTACFVAVCKNIHVLWTRGIVDKPVGPTCDRIEPYLYFEVYVRPWFAFSVVSALPFGVLFFCNFAIIYQMIKVHRMRADQSGNTKTFTQTTTMCLSVSFAFLVCVTPSMVMHIGKAYWPRKGNFPYDVAKVISNLLSYLNHSINFFLYCLTGQRFRNEIVLIVRERRASFLGLDESMETLTTTMSNGGRRFTKPTVSAAISDVSGQLMSYGAAHKVQRYRRETEV